MLIISLRFFYYNAGTMFRKKVHENGLFYIFEIQLIRYINTKLKSNGHYLRRKLSDYHK